jgi:hypothetical protein
MQSYKDTSKIEQALQKVEALMNELGLKIENTGYGIEVTCGDETGYIADTEMSMSRCQTLPRFTEGEKIILHS